MVYKWLGKRREGRRCMKWKEQKGSHLFQASARAACQTYPTVSSGCAMPSKHNFRLGRQRRKVTLSFHARSNVILLNFELLNHGPMVDWESGDSQSFRQRQTASIYKYQLPSSRVIKYDASHNRHWVRWDELFRIGKTHHIFLLSREKKQNTLLKNLQKTMVFSHFLFWPMTSSWHHVLFHVLPPNTGYNRSKALLFAILLLRKDILQQ